MRRLRRLLIGSLFALVVLGGGYWLLTSLVQESPFLDQRLEAAVREALGVRGSYIPVSELETLTDLDASERGIESLDGIEQLPNLRRLNLGGNRIADLRPLASLTRLAALDLRDNYISDLEEVHLGSLEELQELSELSLRNNRESAHPEEPSNFEHISDISPIARLSSLEILDLRNNHVEELSPLGELEALRFLDLRGNRLTEGAVEFLGSLRRLEHLNLRDNDIRDISSLASLEQLEYLNLHSNSRIESILPLSELTSLRNLVVREVPVGGDVAVLRELVALEALNLRDTDVRDLTVLAELMEQGALQDRPDDNVFAEVDIRENPISTPDGYELVEPYWENIAVRHPEELPE
ncbi:MAG: leucine-rich repeat domain-containing protein [Alkalispirochaetaceae bacterium]